MAEDSGQKIKGIYKGPCGSKEKVKLTTLDEEKVTEKITDQKKKPKSGPRPDMEENGPDLESLEPWRFI